MAGITRLRPRIYRSPRPALVSVIALGALGAPSSLARRGGSGGDAGTPSWQPLRIGGGGFIRGMDIAPDGTYVCNTDTYGAYYWNPTAPSPGNAGGVDVGYNFVSHRRYRQETQLIVQVPLLGTIPR